MQRRVGVAAAVGIGNLLSPALCFRELLLHRPLVKLRLLVVRPRGGVLVKQARVVCTQVAAGERSRTDGGSARARTRDKKQT